MLSSADTHPRRRGLPIAVIVVALVLQIGLVPHISLFGARPNCMMALAVGMSLGMQPGNAVLLGFGAGLVFDLTSSLPIGLMTGILSIGCFAISSVSKSMQRGVTQHNIRLSAITIFSITLIYALALVILRIELNIVNSLLISGVLSAAFTLILCLPALALGHSFERGRSFSGTSGVAKRYKVLR
ncbi:rod shape-determining protein MreD [Collinsella sp. zg1085]|uniref:rod shape-determining protein MreD n=1 Tax=Collinsella sp. zg1085 TaxID=2844380 RepID=UPI001C0B8490|nr:rod shape-determining protein MreD [Collinsella sp. zg1085]QWT17062.1 rod shape-determining protein MreD [Collinsella sp. zg1085]